MQLSEGKNCPTNLICHHIYLYLAIQAELNTRIITVECKQQLLNIQVPPANCLRQNMSVATGLARHYDVIS